MLLVVQIWIGCTLIFSNNEECKKLEIRNLSLPPFKYNAKYRGMAREDSRLSSWSGLWEPCGSYGSNESGLGHSAMSAA